jgi:chemotaxis protein methyltransferase WspC
LARVRELCDAAGFDPSVIADVHLDAALQRRRRARGAATLADYAAQCLDDAAEHAEILEELLVRESWFFRDLAPFELLMTLAPVRWPVLSEPIRALSAPCANGEEPYSIAIALAAAGVGLAQIRVDAVDLSRRGLADGEAGRFAARAVAQMPPPLRAEWLPPDADGHYRVKAALRRVVRFHQSNLLALPPTIGATRYDLIFCRNALIYLRPAARQQILNQLESLLAPAGMLVVGHAETALLADRGFSPLGPPGAFAFQRAPVAASAARPTPPARRASRTPPAPRRPASRSLPVIEVAPHAADDRLSSAHRLADQGDYAQAAALLEALLARHFDNIDAQHLLGLVRAAEGAVTEAQRCFQRALYLNPGHQPSLDHLALLAARHGDSAAARQLQRRAARKDTEG